MWVLDVPDVALARVPMVKISVSPESLAKSLATFKVISTDVLPAGIITGLAVRSV